ncbi:MAG: pirin family protein [Pseudomonadota bacterium]
MITVRKAGERGQANFGWLDSRHSFSFGHYFDPEHMGFGPLRVLNDDRVAPGAGFDTHGHKDMEIISYVLEGALEHKDSIGTGSVIRPGDVQRMTAGKGIRHSEFNHSSDDPVHFLQIWIIPEKDGLEPGYEQRSYDEAERRGRLKLVGSRDGRDGSVTIHQDVNLYAGVFGQGEEASVDVGKDRGVWVHVAQGTAEVEGRELSEGDALAATRKDRITIKGVDNAEVLVFDLAA